MPVTLINHNEICCTLFSYRKYMKTMTAYLSTEFQREIKIWLLRVWGMVSDLKAFSQTHGGGSLL